MVATLNVSGGRKFFRATYQAEHGFFAGAALGRHTRIFWSRLDCPVTKTVRDENPTDMTLCS